jgi:hypothetical protein
MTINEAKKILKENGYQINEMIGPFMLQDYIATFTNSDSGKTIEKKVKAFNLVNAAELANKYRLNNEDLSCHYSLTKVEVIPGTYRSMTKDDLEGDPVGE